VVTSTSENTRNPRHVRSSDRAVCAMSRVCVCAVCAMSCVFVRCVLCHVFVFAWQQWRHPHARYSFLCVPVPAAVSKLRPNPYTQIQRTRTITHTHARTSRPCPICSCGHSLSLSRLRLGLGFGGWCHLQECKHTQHTNFCVCHSIQVAVMVNSNMYALPKSGLWG